MIAEYDYGPCAHMAGVEVIAYTCETYCARRATRCSRGHAAARPAGACRCPAACAPAAPPAGTAWGRQRSRLRAPCAAPSCNNTNTRHYLNIYT